MRNTLALAQKELRSYFQSPIAYIVIGFFALVYGFIYFVVLRIFVNQAMQASLMGGGRAMNVNQQVISPVFQNVTVIALFMLPMVTMRSYAEEKRSGTIELLLTSPVSDFQIVMGKFLGALALYAIMLAVSVIHIGILFVYGRPEWKPLVTAYLGLLLLGGCFLSVGLLISSLTKNQIVAGMVTFAVFLFLWIITWIGGFGGSTLDQVTNYLSIIEHYDDFGKGIIDTTNLIYYVSFIIFGLFLTAKSVDSERWRG